MRAVWHSSLNHSIGLNIELRFSARILDLSAIGTCYLRVGVLPQMTRLTPILINYGTLSGPLTTPNPSSPPPRKTQHQATNDGAKWTVWKSHPGKSLSFCKSQHTNQLCLSPETHLSLLTMIRQLRPVHIPVDFATRRQLITPTPTDLIDVRV